MSRRRPSAAGSYALDVVRVGGVEPIFAVADVPGSVAHYERLAFTTSYHDEGYAFAHRRASRSISREDAEDP